MIDLSKENLIPLSEVPNRLPKNNRGKRLAFASVWRWAIKGLQGPDGETIRLETIKVGGRLLTSEEALQCFGERQSIITETVPLPRTPGKRSQSSELAAQRLEEIGI